MKKKIKKICIVGIGKHAYVNLIPSLKKKNYKILGMVTRTPKIYNRKFKRFSKLNTAIKKLPKDTTYLLSTPPRTHFEMIKVLVSQKKNVLVEKPIVTNHKEVKKLYKYNLNKKNFFYELFMYRSTNGFKKSLNYLKSNKDKIKSIEFYFLLPSYPKNTFRDSFFIEDSCLYDVGSYIFNFCSDLEVKIKNLNLIKCIIKKNIITRILFNFKINNIDVKVDIGLNYKYKNNIKFVEKNNVNVVYDRVFFGKKILKNIKISNVAKEFSYNDINGYEEMFDKLNIKKIVKDKLINYNILKETYSNLKILHKKIENL